MVKGTSTTSALASFYSLYDFDLQQPLPKLHSVFDRFLLETSVDCAWKAITSRERFYVPEFQKIAARFHTFKFKSPATLSPSTWWIIAEIIETIVPLLSKEKAYLFQKNLVRGECLLLSICLDGLSTFLSKIQTSHQLLLPTRKSLASWPCLSIKDHVNSLLKER